MSFDSYLKIAWDTHATNAQKLADEFTEKMALVESNEQIAQFAALITHIFGEHLGLWGDGISTLRLLKNNANLKAQSETEKLFKV